MNSNEEKLAGLKKLTAAVYLCQVLSFFLAGLPLLIGIAINFLKKDEVTGTWLKSHFEWQIKTAWVSLAGFAFAGLTFEFGFGIFVLISTIMWMVFRIVVGWNALNANERLSEQKYV